VLLLEIKRRVVMLYVACVVHFHLGCMYRLPGCQIVCYLHQAPASSSSTVSYVHVKSMEELGKFGSVQFQDTPGIP
jgi:hypothetical protein